MPVLLLVKGPLLCIISFMQKQNQVKPHEVNLHKNYRKYISATDQSKALNLQYLPVIQIT